MKLILNLFTLSLLSAVSAVPCEPCESETGYGLLECLVYNEHCVEKGDPSPFDDPYLVTQFYPGSGIGDCWFFTKWACDPACIDTDNLDECRGPYDLVPDTKGPCSCGLESLSGGWALNTLGPGQDSWSSDDYKDVIYCCDIGDSNIGSCEGNCYKHLFTCSCEVWCSFYEDSDEDDLKCCLGAHGFEQQCIPSNPKECKSLCRQEMDNCMNDGGPLTFKCNVGDCVETFCDSEDDDFDECVEECKDDVENGCQPGDAAEKFCNPSHCYKALGCNEL